MEFVHLPESLQLLPSLMVSEVELRCEVDLSFCRATFFVLETSRFRLLVLSSGNLQCTETEELGRLGILN